MTTMTGPPRPGPVPAVVHTDRDTVSVERAWPSVRMLPEGGRVIRIEGRDQERRLRAGRLILAGNPGSSASLELTRHGTDRRLPGLASAVGTGELVVHRLGRRAVVRQADRYVKVLRPGAATETVANRSRHGADLAAAAGFATPTVLATADGRLDLSVLSGTALHDSGGTVSLTEWRAAWDAWAGAWARLAVAPPGKGLGRWRGERLPAHTADDEVAGLRSWLDHINAFGALPHLEQELNRRHVELAHDLATTAADPAVVSHRDLHDKQILWDGAAIGLLDLDTLARAEAACDLANLAVHAELRTLQGLWSDAHRDVVLAAVEGVVRSLRVSPRRLAGYAEATRLRLTMLYAFRPQWVPLMGDWLHERSLMAISSS